MKLNTLYHWILLSFGALIFSYIGFYSLTNQQQFTALVCFGITFFMLFLCGSSIHRKIQDTEKILSSILHKDFSLFPKTEPNNSLKNQAVTLYYQSKQENSELYSYKNLYDTILNKLEIGFMILHRKEQQDHWSVFYANPIFLQILEIPKYNEWNYYQEKIPEFYHLIEKTGYSDSQDFIDISIRESSRQSFSIRTSKIIAYGNEYCVISLESIQKIINQKEKQAWNNLMKVISHELLNTLTPVNSLINNLEYLTAQEDLSTDDQQEIKDSLKIINSKSQQLLHFIDSYRQIAELPRPKMSHFNLNETVNHVLRIFTSEWEKKQISFSKNTQNTYITADEKMIERVLINLLSNAALAVEEVSEKMISLEILELNNRIIVRIQDSGKGVDPKIQNKIFHPFFTTRSNGSGIGLTLSRSIMEAHHGYLTQRNTEKGALFELWFI